MGEIPDWLLSFGPDADKWPLAARDRIGHRQLHRGDVADDLIVFGRITAAKIAPGGVVGIRTDNQQIGALALIAVADAGRNHHNVAGTHLQHLTVGAAEPHLGGALATPSASCASLWKWWKGCTASRHAAGQRLAVKIRSIAAGSAGTAWRYTSSGSFELGIAPSSAKVKARGSLIESVIGASPLLRVIGPE